MLDAANAVGEDTEYQAALDFFKMMAGEGTADAYCLSLFLKNQNELGIPRLVEEFRGYKIVGVKINGKLYSLEDKDQLMQIYNAKYQELELLIPTGTPLYRAIRPHELEDILKDGYYSVLVNTNFEADIGPQVSVYTKDSEYSGVIIRFTTPGPYFISGGVSVPRMTSITGFFTPVELSSDEGKTWLTVEEYKILR